MEALKAAVVMQACKDYALAITGGDAKGKVGEMQATDREKECERFFKSQWFTMLAGERVDGTAVMREVKRHPRRFLRMKD